MARRPERRLVSQVAPWFLAALKRSGGDLCELGARYQLPEDADRMPEFELPLRTLDALTAEIAERLARPHLGVEIIERLPRGSYGLLEFIVRSAPNVRDATRGVARYQGLLNDLVTIRFEERDGAGFLSQRIAGVRECVGVQCNELFVALVVKMLRELVGRDWRPARVWFAHPAPADSSALSEWFGPHLEFDHGLNQVEIPASDLDRAIPSSDPALLATLVEQAELRLASKPSRTDELARIRDAVRRSLRDGPPRLETVASALELSPRTLQRRLTGEATSFQRLVDDVRSELAQKYVADGDRPLGEIAYLLGFSELSAFVRAYKRWTGRTPGQARALAR